MTCPHCHANTDSPALAFLHERIHPLPRDTQPDGKVWTGPCRPGWWYCFDDESQLWCAHLVNNPSAFAHEISRQWLGDGRWIEWTAPTTVELMEAYAAQAVAERNAEVARVLGEQFNTCMEHKFIEGASVINIVAKQLGTEL